MERIKEDFEEYCERKKSQKEENSSSKSQSVAIVVPEPR
jgi:hypothetical protein